MGVRVKTALAVVLAGMLAMSGTAGVMAAANGGAFGQQVKEQVQDCKAALGTGMHGIGECVSDFAQQHGAQERGRHSQGHASHGTHRKSGTRGKSAGHAQSGVHSGLSRGSRGKGRGKPSNS